jgi:hypothetical protein
MTWDVFLMRLGKRVLKLEAEIGKLKSKPAKKAKASKGKRRERRA